MLGTGLLIEDLLVMPQVVWRHPKMNETFVLCPLLLLFWWSHRYQWQVVRREVCGLKRFLVFQPRSQRQLAFVPTQLQSQRHFFSFLPYSIKSSGQHTIGKKQEALGSRLSYCSVFPKVLSRQAETSYKWKFKRHVSRRFGTWNLTSTSWNMLFSNSSSQV